jgi:hypothetical protein
MASSNHVIAGRRPGCRGSQDEPWYGSLLGIINAFNVNAFQELSKDKEEKRDDDNDVAVAVILY